MYTYLNYICYAIKANIYISYFIHLWIFFNTHSFYDKIIHDFIYKLINYTTEILSLLILNISQNTDKVFIKSNADLC